MGFSKLVFANYSGSELSTAGWARVDAICDSKVIIDETNDNFGDELASADGLLLKLGNSADRTRIDQGSELKYIGMLGTGYGRIDTQYAAERDIVVCNVADYSTQGVAEFAVGALIAELRELERARRQASNGDYSEETFTGTDLAGKNVGIVGLGHIGRRTAELVSGFGSTVRYWSRSPKDAPFAERTPDLVSLFAASDVISLHLALNDETDGLIDANLLGALSSGSIIINTAPMELFSEIDLVAWLAADPASKLVLDHSDELSPEQAASLSALDNCVLYPPIAYTTIESSNAKEEVFLRSLEDFVAGSPSNQVN